MIRAKIKRELPSDFFQNWSSFRPAMDIEFRGAAEYLRHERTRPWTVEELACIGGCPVPDANDSEQSSSMKIDLVDDAAEYYFSDVLEREPSGIVSVELYRVQTYTAQSEEEEAYACLNYYDVTGNWTVYFEIEGDSAKIVEVAFDGFTYNPSDW